MRKWDATCASAEREAKAPRPGLGASSWGAANQGSQFSPAYGAEPPAGPVPQPGSRLATPAAHAGFLRSAASH